MQDCQNNTYSCLRTVVYDMPLPASPANSTIFCEFYATDTEWRAGEPYMREYFDLVGDPYQMNNTAPALDPARVAELTARLHQLRQVGRDIADTLKQDDKL